MAITKPDITITRGTWVNLYTASGIAVGTAVTVTNTGNSNCRVAVSLAAPTSTATGQRLYAGVSLNTVDIAASEVGLWALVEGASTTLLVQD